MLFSSITFLYYFLPIALILYFIVPFKFKNFVLLTTSLIFYGWGEPRFLLLMIITIVLGYVDGILIEKTNKKATKQLLVAFIVCASIGILGYFKYADFFINTINAVIKQNIPLIKVVLPIGISFYVFQMLSYVIDVYRGTVSAQKNFISLATYISMFPQLIAGPIVRYKDIAKELVHRTITLEKISNGITRFTIGLGKKVLIANVLGELVSNFKNANEQTVLYIWLYAIAASLQIYFDFSGYSDMAIGLGNILGFDFPENFNYPYVSKSATEFWRRWHMTLGGWFRDYLYIPMGGNRVSKPRYYFNILVVWTTTGLWHGASWNFIIWGIYFAVFLIFEKIFLLKKLERSQILSHIYLLFIVMISFIIFDMDSLKQAGAVITGLFGIGKMNFYSAESIYMLKDYLGILIIGIITATGIPVSLFNKFKATQRGKYIFDILEPVVVLVLLIVCTSFLVNGSFNPFLYFRF